ncbi:MAG TPA: chemotaxis protein CheB [Actinomycetota bacterium]|nr:chemotaxis protein CheB [Actinomycetota bacterium]
MRTQVMRYEIVVVGSSWGGLGALKVLLGGLPSDFRLPVVVAQHRSVDSRDKGLASYYDARCQLPVCAVEDKQPIDPGTVYFAPPDYHLLIEAGTFALSVDERVQFSRPSIDVLFESAVDSFGSKTIGVILTGGNPDGAEGLLAVADAGGFTIVQDPVDAEKPDMPRAALETVPRPGALLGLDEIPPYLTKLAGEIA